MANLLDAHPTLAADIENMREFVPDLVPVAVDGAFYGFVGDQALRLQSFPAALPVDHYVVGLELLGYRFEIGHDGSGLYTLDPSFRLPKAWRDYALSLMAAFGDGRTGELVDFLTERARQDEPCPS